MQCNDADGTLLDQVFDQIILESTEGIYRIDENYIVTHWNPICEKIFEWAENEAIGRDISDLIVPIHERDRYRDDFDHFLKSVDRQQRSFVTVNKHRHEFYIDMKVCRLADRSIVTFIPCTQFGESNSSLTKMLGTAGFFLASKDLAGVYTDVNQNVERALGLKREDIIGKTDDELFSHDVAIRRKELDDEVIRTGSIINVEEPLVINNKEMQVYNTRSAVRDINGNIIGIQVIGRDITDYVNALHKVVDLEKKSLQASEQLAIQSSKMKTQFLANMSHEIRTPVNGILGMNNLLSETPLSDEQKEYVSGIQKMCGSLMSVINDILDLSKLESDRVKIEMGNMNLEELMEDLRVMYLFLAKNKGLTLNFDWSDVKSQTLIKCDYGRLRQVLSNLLNNAVKFTFSGGIQLVVTKVYSQDAGAVYVGGQKVAIHSDTHAQNGETGYLKFSIKDTGIGIEEDKIKDLFKPFTQLDASTTRRFGGSGLGLSIAKSIIELLHGEIHLDSVYGQGTTVWFTIPYVPAETTIRAIVEENAGELSKITPSLNILVVDDNLMNQKVTIKLLEKLGHKALGADNGLEAVQMLQMNPLKFNFVFMDCQMPVMDGYDATKEIRKLPKPLGDITVVAMTANVLSDEKARCLAVGMNDYMSKPVKKDELVAMLHKWSISK